MTTDKVKYWLDIADYDYATAQDLYTPMNIEARYPDYKSSLAASLNQDVCNSLLQQTFELQLWIKSKLLP